MTGSHRIELGCYVHLGQVGGGRVEVLARCQGRIIGGGWPIGSQRRALFIAGRGAGGRGAGRLVCFVGNATKAQFLFDAVEQSHGKTLLR